MAPRNCRIKTTGFPATSNHSLPTIAWHDCTTKTLRSLRSTFYQFMDTLMILQLYVSFRPDSFAQAIKAIENCIADDRAWLVSHRLMFNDSKTEFLIIGSWQQLSKVTIASIEVGWLWHSTIIKHVRNLGAWFDNHMSMNTDIVKVCSKAFKGLYNIRQIRKYRSAESKKNLIHAFVTSHLKGAFL